MPLSDIRSQYQSHIDKFPVGVEIWRLEDPREETSLRLVALNSFAESLLYGLINQLN
jgi:hypothetical protein